MDDELKTALSGINARLSHLEKSIEAHKEAAEMALELYRNLRGILGLLSILERVSIWLAKVGTAVAIIWWIFKESIKNALRS